MIENIQKCWIGYFWDTQPCTEDINIVRAGILKLLQHTCVWAWAGAWACGVIWLVLCAYACIVTLTEF